MNLSIRFEQAVYGSFPFWNRGYGVLAGSAGCRPAWLAALKAACQHLGEPPTGVAEAPALFALRKGGGPWMIVGITPLGDDDAGRPGALAFHALFVDHWTYARAGADPFAFAGLLQRKWGPNDVNRILPPGRAAIRRARYRSRSETHSFAGHESVPAIVEAIAGGRSVIVQHDGPIDELARAVWLALPFRIRLRSSAATWAFDNANRFHLVGVPKLAGLYREETDLIIVRTGQSAPEPMACSLASAGSARLHLAAEDPGSEPRFSS